ncbi:MAG TPA: hypothetical protein VLE91_03835 [Candidatus Saccharimonadales bacterium]|nr:hypothetical protein [Candidatus Saccharimonadales bacterium]
MSKQTKLILSVLGACAIIVPLVLLLTLGSKSAPPSQAPGGNRNIDTQNIVDTAKQKAPTPIPTPSPVASPTAATNSAIPGLIPSPVASAKP